MDIPPTGLSLTSVPPRPHPVLRRLALWGERLHFHWVVRRRFNRLALAECAGRPLLVLPHVFHPGLAASTPFFAGYLAQAEFAPDARVLDLGTGTGACALAVAERVRQVVATDLNPYAVRCVRINALLNGLQDKIDVRRGDLFAPVAGERFERVLFNPPWQHGRARSWLDHALRGEGVLARFAAELPAHLAPGGQALVSLSTECDLAALERQLGEAGLAVETLALERGWIETRVIWSIQRRTRSA